MTPKRIVKGNSKKAKRPKKKFKYIKIVELVEDPYNLKIDMEKKTVQAHIECNNTGFYTVYCEEDFPFGFFGEGFSAEEAKADFLNAFYGMRDRHFKKTGEYVDAEFTFVYDASAM